VRHLRGALVLLAVAAVTPQPQYFRYERPLTVAPASAGTAQACFVLDGGVFARAATGLADLRLYRDTTETPYAIREAAQAEPTQQEIPPLNLGHKGAHTTFEAVMPEGRYSDIDLDIAEKDFIATVAVTGAQTEGGREGTELGLFTIFDLTGQKLGRSTVLHLPESDLKYLYFSIEGAVKPADVHGLSIRREPARQTPYVTVAETSQVAQEGHSTKAEFKVPAHVPVDRVEFAVGEAAKNFSREVTVKATAVPAAPLRSDEEPPQPVVATGNLLRVHGVHDGHQIDEEQLTIDAPWFNFGDDATNWTVTIDNGDDTPLAITAVRLEMAERRLCFDAAPGAKYTLYYGDPVLTAPRYDYATLFAAEKNPALAQLGPEQPNPEYRARPDERPFTERHPGLLWAALILVIVVLGMVALRTAKGTKAA
jgi:Protein of unknown function (DUF3999)